MTTSTLQLSFDPNTIQHLGVSLYSQLPSVLSELVSNSWDADANVVSIEFIDSGNDKEIIYKDDGHGMTFDELNNKYLVIGRNRRGEAVTSPGGRKPIGKKGLGKLSVFGICDIVTIESIKDGLKNRFTMNLQDILRINTGSYNPDINIENESVSEPNSTTIILQGIRRKSAFETNSIAVSLAKKFTIFDQLKVVLIDNLLEEPIIVSNELKFEDVEVQFQWDFPEESITQIFYNHKMDIKGTIVTSKTPIRSPDMRGIYLTSRGKIVNQADFYDARDNDQFHSYVTGYLSVDFIDEETTDLISTDRHSLNWESDITKELKVYLQEIIKKIGADWRIKRKQEKTIELETKEIYVNQFISSLPVHQKELGEKILDPILSAPNVDSSIVETVTKNVIAKFNNEDFKEYATSIVNLDITDANKIELFQYLNGWRVIENKQYAALAETRISVINKFDEYVSNYTREVPTLHNFLKDFPWLIDPRILEFDDEVHFSKVLKDNFPDEELDESNRRIDFLCTKFLGQILYIVEIKHSEYQIDLKALEQADHYQAFIKSKFRTEMAISNVVCYIVGGSIKNDYQVQDRIDTYRAAGKVFAKTYTELLHQSKQYHKEFIEKHRELNN